MFRYLSPEQAVGQTFRSARFGRWWTRSRNNSGLNSTLRTPLWIVHRFLHDKCCAQPLRTDNSLLSERHLVGVIDYNLLCQ